MVPTLRRFLPVKSGGRAAAVDLAENEEDSSGRKFNAGRSSLYDFYFENIM